MSLLVFILLAASVFLVDISLAISVMRRDGDWAFVIGLISAGLVDATYAISISVSSYLAMSVFSSLYFCLIDCMLISFVALVSNFTGLFQSKKLFTVIGIIAVLDIIVLLFINPSTELAISYTPFDAEGATLYAYDKHLLYWCHLIFCYALVAMIVGILIIKAILVPSEYRIRYIIPVVGTLFVVAINAGFLFVPGLVYDISIFIYSLIAMFFYWAFYYFTPYSMRSTARDMIMDRLDQALVFFDYENHLAGYNKSALRVFGSCIEEGIGLDSFLRATGLGNYIKDPSQEIAFLWSGGKDGNTPYNCEYRQLKDKKDQPLAKLFVLTDNTMAADLLTGFDTLNTYTQKVLDGRLAAKGPTAALTFDLNRLSKINADLGRSTGDRALAVLANAMRNNLPVDSYFARLDDAFLMAVVPQGNPKVIESMVDEVCAEVGRTVIEGHNLEAVSAFDVVDEQTGDIRAAVSDAMDALRAKKLINGSSAHLSLLNSLAYAMSLSDAGSEDHVSRTTDLALELGRRINLSNLQLTQLELLCLMHDVGKIGIPLDIINKPTRLTDIEWEIMKTHVEKGAQIAAVSPELSPIADDILHQHENWDGSGYPDGLRYGAIPILSRIIAIVDTFDAITHNRPYRAARSTSAAVAELKNGAGKQFDPYLVSEFAHVIEAANLSSDEEPSGSNDELGHAPRSLDSAAISDPVSDINVLQCAHYTADGEGHILKINDAFTTLTGYSMRDVEEYGLRHIDLIFPDETADYQLSIDYARKATGGALVEHRLRRKDGTERNVICHGRDYVDAQTGEARTEFDVVDIANTHSVKLMAEQTWEKVQRNIEQLEENASTDALTGLLNREALRGKAQPLIDDAQTVVVILIMDIDNFKGYNDTYGHPQGDVLLCVCAQSLAAACGPEALVARLGGDEFCAAIPLQADAGEAAANQLANKIFVSMQQALKPYGSNVGVSMGMVLATDATSTLSELYEKADEALYWAKSEGKMRLVCFDA